MKTFDVTIPVIVSGGMSKKPISDSDVIAMIGTAAIKDHFAVRDAAISQWKKRGIPRGYRKPMVMLGASIGLDMTEYELGLMA